MIETNVRNKIQRLIEQASELNGTSPTLRNGAKWTAAAKSWVVQAQNVVQLAVPDFSNPYRQGFITLVFDTYQNQVQTGAGLLDALLGDIDAGLLSTFADRVIVETFDNFLEHAEAYRARKQKEPAGVIAGVVFEDTVRKIYSKKVGPDAGKNLDQVIIELKNLDIITEQQKREFGVAQFVRNKATHAQWGEFDLKAVDITIELTKSLLKKLND